MSVYTYNLLQRVTLVAQSALCICATYCVMRDASARQLPTETPLYTATIERKIYRRTRRDRANVSFLVYTPELGQFALDFCALQKLEYNIWFAQEYSYNI